MVSLSARFFASISAASIVASAAGATHDPSRYGWILAYESTNAVVWDPKWASFARGIAPDFILGDGLFPRSLRQRFLGGMGGPPEPVRLIGDRYVVLSACVPHDCAEKSMLWIDPIDDVVIGVIAIQAYDGTPTSPTVFSRSVGCRALPASFRTILTAWLVTQNATRSPVGFVGSVGKLDTHCIH